MFALLDNMDADQARAVARRCQDLMEARGIIPTPRNYAVWFAYASGRIKEIERLIDTLVVTGKPYDEEASEQLYAALIGLRDEKSIARDISERLQGVVDRTLTFIQQAQQDNISQSRNLDQIESEAQGDQSSPAEIAEALTREVRLAIERTARLEDDLGSVSSVVSVIRESLQRERQKSNLDPLTGLANRRQLDEFLENQRLAVIDTGRTMSCLFIDIDHFKAFNDSFGHQVGDQVLRLIASVISSTVRSSDLVARYGGEEILIVLPNTDLYQGVIVAEKIRKAIADRRITKRATGEVLSAVTVSIGVAQFRPSEELGNFLERCDQALYLAKRSGRNCSRSERDLVGVMI